MHRATRASHGFNLHSGSYLITFGFVLFSEHLGEEHAFFELDPTRTFVGGLESPILSRKGLDTDFVGCVNDVQFNGYPLYDYDGNSFVRDARSIGRFSLSAACLLRKTSRITISKPV